MIRHEEFDKNNIEEDFSEIETAAEKHEQFQDIARQFNLEGVNSQDDTRSEGPEGMISTSHIGKYEYFTDNIRKFEEIDLSKMEISDASFDENIPMANEDDKDEVDDDDEPLSLKQISKYIALVEADLKVDENLRKEQIEKNREYVNYMLNRCR